MSTVQNESFVRTVVKKVSAYIPQVEKPKKKIGLSEKFIWCGIALFYSYISWATGRLKSYRNVP